MIQSDKNSTIGVLLSGGLDSSILLARLLDRGRPVRPFYIRSGLLWQAAELAAVHRFLAAVSRPSLQPLVALDLPLRDLYQQHWSVTGRNVPGQETADDAVFLPGRNALLVIKAALWCQMHGVGQLALATLGTSPFADAGRSFFRHLQGALNRAGQPPVRLLRPFARLDKRQVMRLGQSYPLQLTFSCIAPMDGLHCGRCNKCAERQKAFRLVPLPDPTCYATAGAEAAAAQPT